jgi:hypothetical protein
MNRVMVETAASLQRDMYAVPPGWADRPPPPPRTLRQRLVTWHWRARERIANAIYPTPEDDE